MTDLSRAIPVPVTILTGFLGAGIDNDLLLYI